MGGDVGVKGGFEFHSSSPDMLTRCGGRVVSAGRCSSTREVVFSRDEDARLARRQSLLERLGDVVVCGGSEGRGLGGVVSSSDLARRRRHTSIGVAGGAGRGV